MTFDASATPSDCPFCRIGTTYVCSPPNTSQTTTPDPDLLSPPAFLVLSSELCMAFLDIMPLSPGHLLVTTRAHHEKISDITVEESREMGFWLPVLSRVLATVTGVHDWNIVQNNGIFFPSLLLTVIPHPAVLQSCIGSSKINQDVTNIIVYQPTKANQNFNHRSSSSASGTTRPLSYHSTPSSNRRVTQPIFHNVWTRPAQ